MRQFVRLILLAAAAFGTAALLSCSSSADPTGPAQLVWDGAAWDEANWE